MRRLQAVFAILITLLLCSASCLADQIPIGLISFDQPNANVFDITDYTGAGCFSACAPSDFPVLTGLTLTGTLTLNGQCGADCVANVTLGPGGVFTFTGAGFDPNAIFTSATFSGTLSPNSAVSVNGNPNPVFLSGTFSVTLTDASGILMPGLDNAVIFATTRSQAVPEPGAILLFSGGLTGIFIKQLRALSKKAPPQT